MIPSEEEMQAIKEEAKGMLTNLPKDWTIFIDVVPFLMCDFMYEIKDEDKTVEIYVYSARYPWTWSDWKREALAECNERLLKRKVKCESM